MPEGNFGYGQQDPWSTTHEANAMYAMVRYAMAQMETMRLVKVIAVNPGSGTPPLAGTVDVQPLVNQVDGMGNSTTHGTVHGIPYVRIAGGDSALIADPAVGDVGYVVCDSRDTSNVRQTGGKQANPGSFRLFDLADGVYVGGLLAQQAPKQYLWFNANGLTLLDRNGNQWVGSSGGIDVTPASGKPETVHGDEVVTGNLTVDGTSDLKGNVHAEGNLTVDHALSALTLQINGGTVFTRILLFSVPVTFGLVPHTGATFTTASCAGVKAGDAAFVTPSTFPGNQYVTISAGSTSNNSVNLQASNASAADQTLGATTLLILVLGTTP